MFVGHYGISFAAKKADASIVPGITASNPLDLYYVPYTHSLVAAILWSVGAFVLYRLAAPAPDRIAALLVALAVFSLWVLAAYVVFALAIHFLERRTRPVITDAAAGADSKNS
jgi:hypothetical protein